MQIRTVKINGKLLASLAFVFMVGLAWVKHEAVYDWWRLRGYEPSAAVAQLAQDTTMNDTTRRLFYVYHPDLQDKTKFNQHCSGSEKTIVLGCYIHRQGIYLYDVTDDRLKGIEQVTAAHETLHAAYDRLNHKDREWVNAQTGAVYAKITDKRLRDTIEAYRSRDPSVVPNELHSILGTEVANLPPDLENYYKRYFADRAAVVRFSQQYEQEFTTRQEKVAAADANLQRLKAQIAALDKTLEAQVKDVNAEYDRMQQLRRSNQIEAYNARVSGYNQMVGNYNANVRKQQGFINEYNTLVSERNALAVEENELIKAIDSRPTTIQTQ
jgi:galactokinase